MKTIGANKHESAVKELNGLDKKQAGKLPSEVKHSDRKHYHVACVSIIDQPGEAKNKVVVSVSKLHAGGFAKLEKNYKHLGFNRIIILHDPTLLEESEVPTVPAHQKESIEAKIRRELDEKHKAEIDAKVKEGIAEALKEKEEGAKGAGTDGEEVDEVFAELIASGLKDDFIKFAEDNSIDISTATNNDERKALIVAWKKEQSTTK